MIGNDEQDIKRMMKLMKNFNKVEADIEAVFAKYDLDNEDRLFLLSMIANELMEKVENAKQKPKI